MLGDLNHKTSHSLYATDLLTLSAFELLLYVSKQENINQSEAFKAKIHAAP